jgi:hypothetical protein
MGSSSNELTADSGLDSRSGVILPASTIAQSVLITKDMNKVCAGRRVKVACDSVESKPRKRLYAGHVDFQGF